MHISNGRTRSSAGGLLGLVALMLVTGQITEAEARTLKVVATVPDLAAIAQEVGNERVEVASIGRGRQNPHFVDPKPSFIVQLNRTDLLIDVGLELEIGWLPPLVVGARNGKIQDGGQGRVVANLNVPLLEVPAGRVDRSMGDVHSMGNPHYLMDPVNGKIVAENIYQGLSRADPASEPYFRQNLERFQRTIDRKLVEWLKEMAPYRGRKIVSYHKTYTYFAQRFGLVVAGQIEPLPGIPPSPAHITQLIALMRAQGVRLIVIEPWYDRKVPELVAQQTGAALVMLPPMVGGVPEIKTYTDLFDHGIALLVKAFGRIQ
jgi:ABC-type Zn uptake system ZnuABC Zn-binding protein ZnuA